MADKHHRQRVERRVHVTPYRTGHWEPFQDWALPTSTIWDQDFGMPITSARTERGMMREPWPPGPTPTVSYVTRSPVATQPQPSTRLLEQKDSGGLSQVSTADGKYQILLDVKHFTPEEITVKTVGDTVEITGSHDEKQDDHGVISRNFTRKYTLPKGVDAMSVISSLSSDGFLTVEAPMSKAAIEDAPKPMPVKHEAAKNA